MKKIILALFILICLQVPVFAGMFVHNMQEAGGLGYSDSTPTKKGSATCINLVHLIGWGNCSIDKARKNGNISKINYWDKDTKNVILGFIIKIETTNVYGQ